ncbi:hypothetical protein L7F22_035104, partial [Adiantum nelumboides]|nr:hypothetical protein [Adiantum nelumboides]
MLLQALKTGKGVGSRSDRCRRSRRGKAAKLSSLLQTLKVAARTGSATTDAQ